MHPRQVRHGRLAHPHQVRHGRLLAAGGASGSRAERVLLATFTRHAIWRCVDLKIMMGSVMVREFFLLEFVCNGRSHLLDP